MKITQHELEQIMHEQLLKQIHIMYDIHLENYAVLPEVHEEVRHKREYAVIESNDWNLFLDSLERVFFELDIARDIVSKLKPVYDKYKDAYMLENDFDMDTYMQAVSTDYDADEFERVKDMFEEKYTNRLQIEDEPTR